MSFHLKYLKYKRKYLDLKGGAPAECIPSPPGQSDIRMFRRGPTELSRAQVYFVSNFTKRCKIPFIDDYKYYSASHTLADVGKFLGSSNVGNQLVYRFQNRDVQITDTTVFVSADELDRATDYVGF